MRARGGRKGRENVKRESGSAVLPPSREAAIEARKAELSVSSEERQAMLKEAQNQAEEKEKFLRSSIGVSQRMKVELDQKRNEDANFKLLQDQRQKLPASQCSDRLLHTIKKQQVTIIAGDTGCGKTTQVPQLVLDDAIDAHKGAATNILCIQPRRVAAISVSTRVATERNEDVGDTVGYSIRLESRGSNKTQLQFVTTGVLLRRLQTDPLLAGVSHVVLDEVHERSVESDFLLVLLKNEVLKRRPTLKLICMSATINAEEFEQYFSEFSCSLVSIPGRQHPVKTFHLEDVVQMCAYEPQHYSDCCVQSGRSLDNSESNFLYHLKQRGYSYQTINTLQKLDVQQLDLELATQLIRLICTRNPRGAILVFLPGLQMIQELQKQLQSDSEILSCTHHGDWVLPLHSSLSSNEQAAVFQAPLAGVRKVVLSTNIAETSVTVPDVVYVIDGGKQKLSGYNPTKRMQTLEEMFVSQASAKQRRGRAGRAQPGVAFRLYTSLQYEQMREYEVPEIKRVPLEGLCLQMKLQGIASAKEFLSSAPDAPSASAIESALGTLKAIGALDDSFQKLSNLGILLAQLPLDVHLAKLLLHSLLLGVLDPCLTIAAFLASRSPFVAPMQKKEEADEAKASFAVGQSDHLAVVQAYNDWIRVRKEGKQEEKQFVYRNFLSLKALEQLRDLRSQFVQSLRDSGFLQSCGIEEASQYKNERPLIRCAIVSGLYPNIARIDLPAKARNPPMLRVHNEDGIDETVQLSPSCTLKQEPSNMPASTRWLVYFERVMQSSMVIIKDCTPVQPFELLLFGGKIGVQHGAGAITMDGWATFAAPAKVGSLVRLVRTRVDEYFSYALSASPGRSEHLVSHSAIVQAVQRLLHGR